MKVTLLDTATGRRCDINDDGSPLWWAEGNGSCDCNRGLLMKATTMDNCPCGHSRFLIVSSDSDEYSLREMNSDYPEKLLKDAGL